MNLPDTERDQFLLRGRVVIPALGHFTVAVGSGFFPRTSSPKATLAFVSLEISSVSGSFRTCSRTCFTVAKIASVASIFFSSLPF